MNISLEENAEHVYDLVMDGKYVSARFIAVTCNITIIEARK